MERILKKVLKGIQFTLKIPAHTLVLLLIHVQAVSLLYISLCFQMVSKNGMSGSPLQMAGGCSASVARQRWRPHWWRLIASVPVCALVPVWCFSTLGQASSTCGTAAKHTPVPGRWPKELQTN